MMAKPPAGKKSLRVINDGNTEDVSLDALVRHPKNPRKGNVNAIAASIDANGFYGSIIVQRGTNYVLAGNHRVDALKAAGIDTVPVTWVNVDEKQAEKILAADNKTSDLATYDEAKLADLLRDLQNENDLAGTGYDDSEVTKLLDTIAGFELPNTEEIIESEQKKAESGDAGVDAVTDGWGVIVTCKSEDEQLALLERLMEEGYECRCLIQ